MNKQAPTPPQNTYQSLILNYLKSLKGQSRTLKSVQLLVKMLDSPEDIDTLAKVENIPESAKTKTLNFLETVTKKYSSQQPQIMKQVREKVIGVMNEEESIWEAAAIMLNARCIMKLSLAEYESLKDAIRTGEVQQIASVCAKLFAAHKSLEEELRLELEQVTYRRRKITNINSLITQIAKSKPKYHGVFEKLRLNRSNLSALENQSIEVANELGNVQVKGTIAKAYYSPQYYCFAVRQKQQERGEFPEVEVKVHAGSAFIDTVEIIKMFSVSLKQEIQKSIRKPREEDSKLEMQTLFEECLLVHDSPEMNQQQIPVPPGEYRIQSLILITEEKPSIGYTLIFTPLDREASKLSFRVVLGKNRRALRVVNEETSLKYEFSQFTRLYSIRCSRSTTIKYRFSNQSGESIRIERAEHRERDLLEVIEEISYLRKKLVDNVLNKGEDEFRRIMREFISTNTLSEGVPLLKQINSEVDLLVQLHQEAHLVASRQQLLKQLLADANYASLVVKQQVSVSAKTIELFAKSENYISSMSNKSIISFYGNTGAGKSTAVNYFTRIPLKKVPNACGELVVEIVDNELTEQETKNRCVIGQSSGISETVCSKGYTIAQSRITEQDEGPIKDIVFCDNPGFKDTRGASYGIVTNLSMDRAIEVCASVKAIVLVVPYESMFSDKGNNIISLFEQMELRFPNFSDTESVIFRQFFILITKWTGQLCTSVHLQNKIVDYHECCEREMRKIGQSDILEYEILKRRRNFFRSLQAMILKGKVDFIDIDDEIEREDVLAKYIQGEEFVPKQEYVPTLTNNSAVRRFTDEISLSAHSWTKQIMETYIKTLPEARDRIKEEIGCLLREEEALERERKELLQEMKETTIDLLCEKKSLRQNERQYDRIHQERFTEMEIRTIQSSSSKLQLPSMLTYYHQRISASQQSIFLLRARAEQKSIRCKQLKESILRLDQRARTVKEEKLDNEVRIKRWQHGIINEKIIDEVYELGEVVSWDQRRFTDQQISYYMSKSKVLPKTNRRKAFIAGKQQNELCEIYKIERCYKLWPSEDFDPYEYLSMQNVSKGGFNSTIQSNGFTLDNVKFQNQGRIMLLSSTTTFPVSENPDDMPYLIIEHQLPSAEHYSAQIKNAKADNNQLNEKIKTLEKDIRQKQVKLQLYAEEIRECNQQIDKQQKAIRTYEAENEKEKTKKEQEDQAKSRREKVQLLQANISSKLAFSKDNVAECQQKMGAKQKEEQKIMAKIDELKKEKQQKQKELADCEFRLQRFRFLIEDQLQKQTLQSMVVFIRVASEMCHKILANNRVEQNNQDAFRLKMHRFQSFLDQYQSFLDNYSSVERKIGERHRQGEATEVNQSRSVRENEDSFLKQEEDGEQNMAYFSLGRKKVKLNEVINK